MTEKQEILRGSGVVRVVHRFRRNGPRFTCISLSAVQRFGRAITAKLLGAL